MPRTADGAGTTLIGGTVTVGPVDGVVESGATVVTVTTVDVPGVAPPAVTEEATVVVPAPLRGLGGDPTAELEVLPAGAGGATAGRDTVVVSPPAAT